MTTSTRMQAVNKFFAIPSVLLVSATFAVSTASPALAAQYRSGTYRTTVMYDEGTKGIKVAVVVNTKDTIIDQLVETTSSNPIAQAYTRSYSKSVSEQVVGKKLQNAKVKVSGATQTDAAYNTALDRIRNKALKR